MKKLIYSLLLTILISTTGVLSTPAVAAPSGDEGIFTLADLGLDADMVMRGPYDSRAIRFNLPATWVLQTGAELEIEVTSFFVGNSDLAQNNFLGAILDVSFNDQLQQSIPLTSGDKIIYRVPIALENLVSPYEGGWHKLSFFLDAAVDCDFDFHETTVVIDVNSKVHFPYEEAPISMDLQRLPWPIFLERGKIIDPVTVVLPASPSAEELQAGLVVMGAFGRMSNGNLPLTSITANQLTEDILNQSHLLVVGKPSAFPMFADLGFPVPLVGGSFSSPELNQDDGIVQILTSPWNTNRVILMVSGNTDLGVVKASQALSTSNMQTGNTPDYSIIAQVNPIPSTGVTSPTSVTLTSTDITFSDLGYTFTTATGIGTHWISYEFMIPAGQMPTNEAYLDLNISTSALVDSQRSEGVLYLNDIQIGSIQLSVETSNLVTTRIYLPLSAIRPGLNLLDVVFNLLPRDECSIFTYSGLWVTAYPDSMLHLPLTQSIDESSSYALQDLKGYPSPYTNDPSLGTTAFVLAQDDPYSWMMAGKIAYDLGTRATSPILGFRVVFDGQIPDEAKTNNLILVGEPRNLGILSELKEAMPAYFESGSNLAVLESQQVIYRISAEKSLGYLQLFPSPWNEQAAILGVFGTTPDGLGYAVRSLLDADTRDALAGNFATLDGSNALVVDTRTGLGIGRIGSGLSPYVTQVDIPSPTETSPSAQVIYDKGKQLIFAGILGVVALIIVMILVALRFRIRKI